MTAIGLPKMRWFKQTTTSLARRTGLVRLEGRTFADGGGPYLGIGVTLFPAVSVFHADRDRLRANLAVLSGRADYVRVFAVVGPSQSWADSNGGPARFLVG